MRSLDDTGRAIDGLEIVGGDVFFTASQRITTPFPKQKREKFASMWLIDNAVIEAGARGDDFNAPIFKNTIILKNGELVAADREGMLMYLFGCSGFYDEVKNDQ